MSDETPDRALIEWSADARRGLETAQARADEAVEAMREFGKQVAQGSATGRFSAGTHDSPAAFDAARDVTPAMRRITESLRFGALSRDNKRYYYWDFGQCIVRACKSTERKDGVTYFESIGEAEAVGEQLSQPPQPKDLVIRWGDRIVRPPDPVPPGPSGQIKRRFPSGAAKPRSVGPSRSASTQVDQPGETDAGPPPTARTPDTPGSGPG